MVKVMVIIIGNSSSNDKDSDGDGDSDSDIIDSFDSCLSIYINRCNDIYCIIN